MDILSLEFGDLSLFFLLINVLFGLKVYQASNKLKWLEVTLGMAFLIQILAKLVGKFYGNNLPLLHLYTILEFVFISLFYWRILFRKSKYGLYFPHWIVLIVLLIIGNTIFIQSLFGYNSNAKGLTQMIIIAYAVIYFFNRISLDELENNLILNRINAAILLYYSGSLFIFIFSKFLSDDVLLHHYFWEFNALLYLVFQILILIATWRLVFPKSKEIKREG